MKFRIFANHPSKDGFTRASPDSPAIITKTSDFRSPSLDWQPLDEEAHKCLVAYAERKFATAVEQMSDAERARHGTAQAKARFLADRVRPLPKASEAKALEAEATAARADDFEPLTLKEFAAGGKGKDSAKK